jgi:hypothetical protein
MPPTKTPKTPAQTADEYAQVVKLVVAGAPRFNDDGSPLDPDGGALAVAQHGIKYALLYGATPQQVATFIVGKLSGGNFRVVRTPGGMSHTDAWQQVIGKSDGAFDGIVQHAFVNAVGGSAKPGMTPAEIKAEASNGANHDEAERDQAFFGYDGKKHHIEDADYHTQREAFLAVPYTPPVPPGPDAPPATGGGGTLKPGSGIG